MPLHTISDSEHMELLYNTHNAKFLDDGPTPDELVRYRGGYVPVG